MQRYYHQCSKLQAILKFPRLAHYDLHVRCINRPYQFMDWGELLPPTPRDYRPAAQLVLGQLMVWFPNLPTHLVLPYMQSM